MKNRTDQILQDISRVNLRIHTHIAEVLHHIKKTKREIDELEKLRDRKDIDLTGEAE
jgi:hypothetical protein